MSSHPRVPPFVVLATLQVGCGIFANKSTNNSGWYADDTGSTVYTQPDEDGDGYPESDDCNDLDASINPDAIEICDNEVDDDCDELIDAMDTDDCGLEDTGVAAIDWQRLDWCAPEAGPAGLRPYRRLPSPFRVSKETG